MDLNQQLLRELSNLFLGDLRSSEYYRDLSADDRANLEKQLARDAANGRYPLVPGASPDQIAKLRAQSETELGVPLPSSLLGILTVIDGFVENGVSLYGADKDPNEEETVPGLVAQNLALWSAFPDSAQKYLFVGDSELWFFAHEIPTSTYVALSRSPICPIHRFSGIEALVNDMLAQALGRFGEYPENGGQDLPSKAPKLPGSDFSQN
ncbi:MAG TPA: YrhA family protein [Chthoniobacterales bacterium]|nr:YrhA family protein [Chthoniobacterales bacterium]